MSAYEVPGWVHLATVGLVRGPLLNAYVPSHQLYFSDVTVRSLLDRCGCQTLTTIAIA